MFISLLSALKEKGESFSYKNQSRTKYFPVNSRKRGFTRPLTGLLGLIFGSHKQAWLPACPSHQLTKPQHLLPPQLCFFSSVISPRTDQMRPCFWCVGRPCPAVILQGKGEVPCSVAAVWSSPHSECSVTEQMFQLRGCHLLSESSLWEEMPAARPPPPLHVHKGNSL